LQYFKENQFFSNRVLRKVYKYVPPGGAQDDKPDADGITEAMLNFDWGTHVEMPVSETQKFNRHILY
jgi:template-activating factor I